VQSEYSFWSGISVNGSRKRDPSSSGALDTAVLSLTRRCAAPKNTTRRKMTSKGNVVCHCLMCGVSKLRFPLQDSSRSDRRNLSAVAERSPRVPQNAQRTEYQSSTLSHPQSLPPSSRPPKSPTPEHTLTTCARPSTLSMGKATTRGRILHV
jgi:hypothetical protein